MTDAPITEVQLLDLFGHVQDITGYLDIDGNANLNSLEGMHSLTFVGGFLALRRCARLSTLEGLRGVTFVGGYMYIRENVSLTTLEGLRGVTTVCGDLNIHSNAALTTLEGLRNLEVIRNAGRDLNSLALFDNPNLAHGLPFPKLRVNNGGVYLGGEPYGHPVPNAYVASHRAALERVPRALEF